MSDIYYEIYMTRVLRTAGISNVDNLIFENLTYFRWKALKQLEHSPRKKDTFTVYTFEGLQFIFYKDEFKVWLNTSREIFSPMVTWSSAVLVTPSGNRNVVPIAFLNSKYSVDCNLAHGRFKMFSEVKIEIFIRCLRNWRKLREANL